jgi:hypothetical protein
MDSIEKENITGDAESHRQQGDLISVLTKITVGFTDRETEGNHISLF